MAEEIIRTHPKTNRREGGTFSRDETRSEDAGVAEGQLRQGRVTQSQSEKMTSLPTSGLGMGSKEEVPIVFPLKPVDHITITKAAGWWVAVVLAEVANKKQIGIYLWQKKKDGKWHRKQKFTIHSLKKWQAIQEAVQKFIPQLG